MKLFDKKTMILLISVISINILCIISVSYAYFTAQIVGNKDAKEMVVHAGTMTITYADTNEASLNNALPGDSVTKTFKVENTGTLDAKYNIKIDINTNEFEDYSDLTYTLTKNGTPEEEKVLPYEDGYIVVQNEIASTTIDNYSLKVTFKKDETDQNDNANKKVDFTIVVDSNDEVKLYEYKEPYKDNSGANRPKLYQGLIPIRFTEENTMVIADITDTEHPWYNYDEHRWGNAVLIDNTNQDIVNKFYNEDGTLNINNPITEEDILQMYVWIPRYKYELFNAVNGNSIDPQEIQIQFEKGVTSTGNVTCNISNTGVETCANDKNGNWFTHPAFTFGDTELAGIWVGKFESSGVINDIKILPDTAPILATIIYDMFNASRSVELTNSVKYSLKPEEIDTHMMKNMEWGAMTYLTQSKYGRCDGEGNCTEVTKNSQTYKTGYDDNGNLWNTGDGQLASTTGNMYGIYDTNGDAWEYVMGVTINDDGSDILYSYSGFDVDTIPKSKYYDLYEYGTRETDHQKSHLGDAIRETMKTFGNYVGGWYDDYERFPYYTGSWFVRGAQTNDGIHSGIFALDHYTGQENIVDSFRVALTAQDGVDEVN